MVATKFAARPDGWAPPAPLPFVFVMPGTLFERPGYFRISLTASPEMVERALPAFEAAATP